mmetsp:Transcript_22249/g.40089  ORF Transcript_22249/g.40089 Transcript_22249/m.40089 type:complete len:264 (-) Transcript_22249:13-804(-)
MLHHVAHILRWIVDENIHTANRVKLALHSLEIGNEKVWLLVCRQGCLCSFLCLTNHCSTDVTSFHNSPSLCEWNGEVSCATPCIANSFPCNCCWVQPRQDLVHGLSMAYSDVLLHCIDIIFLTVDLLPSLEALVVEIVLHNLLVIYVLARVAAKREGCHSENQDNACGRKQRRGAGVVCPSWQSCQERWQGSQGRCQARVRRGASCSRRRDEAHGRKCQRYHGHSNCANPSLLAAPRGSDAERAAFLHAHHGRERPSDFHHQK